MISRLMGPIELTLWPQISAVLFFVGFLALLVWVYRPSAAPRYESESKLPLLDREDIE